MTLDGMLCCRREGRLGVRLQRMHVEDAHVTGEGWVEGSPLVSVITPAFNAEQTIERTLRSIAAQTLQNWEMVVVDDGSCDLTAERVQRVSAGDGRVRLLRQQNRGASAARNLGDAAACGRWLLFLDADDTVRPTHLQRLVRREQVRPDAAVVCCDAVRLDGTGRTVGVMRAPP